jgi:2-(1,2-epoxy-1,2-dihydrophenyl)acetyl-CoA isomerase
VTDLPGPTSDGLREELDGAVLTLTIDRADVGNALNQETRDSIVGALRRASADLAVRSVILTGAGDRAFCSGADLRATSAGRTGPEGVPARVQGDMARVIASGWQALITAVLDCEKPVIAAVNGIAAGGGMPLVLACDLVVMADTARLIPVFVRRGLAPDAGGAYLTTQLVGPQRAKALYLLGDDVSSQEALRIGLVTDVVPSDELRARALALAERLAQGPTRALAMTKAMINHASDLGREAALSEEAWAQEMIANTADASEGIRSFLERRPAQFRGF